MFQNCASPSHVTLSSLGTGRVGSEVSNSAAAVWWLDDRTKGYIENHMAVRDGEGLVLTFNEDAPLTLTPDQASEPSNMTEVTLAVHLLGSGAEGTRCMSAGLL